MSSSSPLDFFAYPASPACRAVHMMMEVTGTKYRYIETHPLRGGTKTKGFLQMNPWHTIPVVREEDGFTVSESRAILAYLADRQGEQGKIENPSDARGRAMVNMMLHFDISTLYRAMLDAVGPVMFGKESSIPEDKLSSLRQALQWLEDKVSSSERGFCCPGGLGMTAADLSLLSSYESVRECGVFPEMESAFPAAARWRGRCARAVPNFDKVCAAGAKEYGDYFKMMMIKNAKEREKN